VQLFLKEFSETLTNHRLKILAYYKIESNVVHAGTKFFMTLCTILLYVVMLHHVVSLPRG